MTKRMERAELPYDPLAFSDRAILAPGTVPGAAVLSALPAELAVPVWDVLRAVHLLAGGAADPAGYTPTQVRRWEREILRSALPDALRFPLAVLVRGRDGWASADREPLSLACVAVAEAPWRPRWRASRRRRSAGPRTAGALPILRDLALIFDQPAPRAQVLAALARASGVVQEQEVFEDAWSEAVRILGSEIVGPQRAAARIDLGLGAAHFAPYERAEWAFSSALRVAEDEVLADMVERAGECLIAVARPLKRRIEASLSRFVGGDARTLLTAAAEVAVRGGGPRSSRKRSG